MDISTQKWYLLYDGNSEDGRGPHYYIGRTLDSKVALKHFKIIKKNPYSTGRVEIVTDDKIKVAYSVDDFK